MCTLSVCWGSNWRPPTCLSVVAVVYHPWNSRGCTWHLLVGPLAVAVAHTCQGQWLPPASRSPSCGGSLWPPLEPMMSAVACTHPQSSCRLCPVVWEPMHRERNSYGGPVPLLRCPPEMAPCFSGGLRLLPSAPSVVTLQPFQAVSPQSTPGFYLGLTSEAWASAPSPCPHQWMSVSGWGVQGSSSNCLCRSLSILPSANHLLCFPLRLWSSPSIQADLPTTEGASQGWGSFHPSQLPPWGAGPILIPFSFTFFFFPTWLCGGFLDLSEVFCQHSIDVLCDSFHL